MDGYPAGMPPEQTVGRQRITLMVVFWAAKMTPKPGPPGSGPMRALPSASSLRASLGEAGQHDSGQDGSDVLGAHR